MFSFGASVISRMKSLRVMDRKRVHESAVSIHCHSIKTRNDEEVIIVGAGVAGSALAYSLGKDGRQVLLIERNLKEPNRIVGEVLQPGGYQKSVELGLDDCIEDIDAQQILGYALYKGRKCLRIDYNLDKSEPNVTGISYHHGRFVQRMRNKAASLSNVHLEQGLVKSLVEERGTVKGVIYNTNSAKNGMSAVEKGKIRFMPTSSMPATPYSTPGAILLGDALNMRHPITGGGMTVALYDVVTLRDQLRRVKKFEDTIALTKVVEKFYCIRKLGAFKVNICAGGIYELGSGYQGEAREGLMQAIFDYLSLSSILMHGAIQLISCLNPKPWILILNLTGLAVFTTGRLLLPLPTPTRVLKLAKVIWARVTIFVPLILEEGLANMFFPIKYPGLKWKFWRKRNRWAQESNQD